MATPIEINSSDTPKTSLKPKLRRKTGLRIQEFFYLCLQNWYWFVISVVICMACAFIYIKRTTPLYQKSASILIKSDSNGRTTNSGTGIFEDLGVTSNNSAINDEIQVLSSPDLMRDVVRKLDLNILYSRQGKFRTIPLYGTQVPVQILLPDLKEEDVVTFKFDLSKGGKFTISDITLNGKPVKNPNLKGSVGTDINSSIGQIQVLPSKYYSGNETFTADVRRLPVKTVASQIGSSLKVETEEKAWNMVNMTITDWSPERASDILAQVIKSYSDRWMQEKRTLADNTSKFIDERVNLLQDELGSVDDDISSFKSANMVPDIDAAASIAMSQASQASVALKDLRNQEYMAKYIRNYLRNTDNINRVLPTNTGFASSSLSGQISMYNSKILERNSLVSQSSESNPLVTRIDSELEALRGALLGSIDNELISLQEQIRSQEGLTGSATSRIASNPKQAKYLLSVERQQKVKETLYLYLLQKREENQLSQAFTSYNTRIVREPDGSNGPISPNTSNIFLVAFLIGLALPTIVVFLREQSVHVVRGRVDIADMKIPMAGELPLAGKHQKLPRFTPKKMKKASKPMIVVKENNRNSINEAFRVLRTNLEFMYAENPDCQVVMLTSANPGSGKTFVTYNLARSFAIKGKKVIALDLDMRKASLSKYMDNPTKGVSDYLANKVNDITSIIIQDETCPNMSAIPVGTIPPNPTELLYNERLNALIKDLRLHYDYVFIDCPPIEVVADASIISKNADRTLFVIRAGLLDLSMVDVIDEIYEKGTYPSMSVILNGTVNPKNTYTNRYGNPFRYGYGYGTGYTYSTDE